MSNLSELLNRVVETGEMPTREDVYSVVDAGESKEVRATARRGILDACKNITAAVQQGYRKSAVQIAEEATEGFARYTKAGAGASMTEIPRHLSGSAPAPKRINRATLEPLQGIFDQAANGHAVYADEIAELPVTDAPEAKLTAWRAEVAETASTIRQARQRGQNGLARRLAHEATAEYGAMLRGNEPEHHDDVSDPSALADLIRRG